MDHEVLDSPDDTVSAGKRLAEAARAAAGEGAVIYLRGDLGAGKTTFARGFLEGFGHRGRVPSPTYTLVEPYELDGFTVYHIDLYRLSDPSEVDELGIAELDGPGVILLIEWPDRGAGRLQGPDLALTLEVRDSGRALRREGFTSAGERLRAHKIG
ncbi:MAG: tRNA (adenosine(37)-N6)-threonylcarbamoyltransferase complex ATPase subunit type 1 TsaE [Gammaproteobacteria bacterium]|nr:tRNA (adenosine(37)-N6)-threonylcarbamoyltransferase complex ATPase subunit type 1 TsaE [Gammaproteobacteria bacterium]